MPHHHKSAETHDSTVTVNGLATQTGIDRRTIAKRLDRAQVPVARSVNGAKFYRLADALPVVRPPQKYSVEVLFLQGALSTIKPLAACLMSHTNLTPEECVKLSVNIYEALEPIVASLLDALGEDPATYDTPLVGTPQELQTAESKAALLKELHKYYRAEG